MHLSRQQPKRVMRRAAVGALVGVSAGVVVFFLVQRVADEARERATVSALIMLDLCLRQFERETSRPLTIGEYDQLIRRGSVPLWNVADHRCQALSGMTTDSWGRPFHYLAPGKRNVGSFDLWSDGGDGKPGGEGTAADIGNWEFQRPPLD